MRQQSFDIWAWIKGPVRTQQQGAGNYTNYGATDNAFQRMGIDSTGTTQDGTINPSGGNAVNTMQDVDLDGRTLINNPNGCAVGGNAGTPGTPTVAPNTAGSSYWAYSVVYRYSSGVTTLASTPGSTSLGAASLSSTVVNTVSGTAPAGAAYIDIYRTAAATSPTTTGLVNSIPCNALPANGYWSWQDTGVAGDGTSTTTLNTTGLLKVTNGIQDFKVIAIQPPSLVTVAPQGTAGTTDYAYEVAAVTVTGTIAVSAVIQNNFGNATLTATNSMLITWKAVPGAVSYRVYRTLANGTPSTTGLIATVGPIDPPPATYTFIDTGIAVSQANPPGAGFNNTGAIQVSDGSAQCYAEVQLSASQIQGMYTASIPVIPAPDNGQIVFLDQVVVEVLAGSTPFTGGGAVSFIYHGTATAANSGTLLATVVQAAANTKSYTLFGPAVATNGTTVPVNTGIDITNATGLFAAGNGIMILRMWYKVVTVP